MKRRRFLRLAGGAVAAAAAALWWLRRPAAKRGKSDAARRNAPDGGDSDESAGASPLRIRDSDVPLLLALADVIVPRFGDSPAASEIDFRPRFETLLAASPDHATFYDLHLPFFLERVRARVPMPGGRPDSSLLTRLCEHWYSDLRRDAQPGRAAIVFGALRNDVLRVYYASPAGWEFTGFDGPVHWTAERISGRA